MRKRLEDAFLAAEATGMICTVCGRKMKRQDAAMKCPNGHTFNGNRRGYFNFLSRPFSGAYDRALFESRRRVLEAGCYQAVVDEIRTVLSDGDAVLDIGCGDGYYIRALRSACPSAKFTGVDISRDAIEAAADGGALWCVADMRHLPFRDHAFDLLLDILSPADYAEFRRVLKPDGMLVKVTPGPKYLAEIREARGLTDSQSAADRYLGEHMQILRAAHVFKAIPVDGTLWADFVRMTPMNQDLTEQEICELAARPTETVTIDLNISFAKA
ncbi:MAG: methyltransferase domain-containing protein [Clostridia bacterium]|nr:methyltransferase domain-containing protein [Clostridia bacterium]